LPITSVTYTVTTSVAMASLLTVNACLGGKKTIGPQGCQNIASSLAKLIKFMLRENKTGNMHMM